MQSAGSAPLASCLLMKVVIEEFNAARRPRLHKLAGLAATAVALAAIAAIGIVTASLAIILLPIALLAAWWLRASPIERRRPR